MRTALTIAGSDSSGFAGIQADLRTFADLGLHGATAITAITAQNSQGVSAIAPLPADLVTAQIESAASDVTLAVTKIGMLATAAIVEAVAAAVEDLDLPLVVLDPVLASSSGTRLLDDEGVQAMLLELLPIVRVVTPNVPEAEALSGRRIRSFETAREAAQRLHDMGARAVIIKGGHADWMAGNESLDLLYDGRTFYESRVPRVGARARGTGCRFASAVAAYLALGDALPEAAAKAQQYVAGRILNEHAGTAAHRT